MFIIKFQSNTLGSESDTIFFFNTRPFRAACGNNYREGSDGYKRRWNIADRIQPFAELSQSLQSSTTIEFSLPKSSLVNLTIYNMLGQEVKTLINRELNEGIHQVIWNAEVPSGTYFYRLTTNNGFVSG